MASCKAFISTQSGKKTRRCKKSAKENGLCSSHKQKELLLTKTKEELVAANAMVMLSQSSQTQNNNVVMSDSETNTKQEYTHPFANYKDTINSMEREYNNSMEYLNVEFQKLKSHLTLTELDKMEVLCTGTFEKYEDYSNSLKHDIDNQLDYYENIIERLYEDRKIIISNMKYREEQVDEMKRLISDARERLTYLHDLLTL